MPYWLDWMIRDSHFPLSNEYKQILLSEKSVNDSLKKGNNPIDISIDKWEKIIISLESIKNETIPTVYFKDLLKYLNYRSCALCITSEDAYIKKNGKIIYGDDKCKLCLLATIDTCTIKGSIFDQIYEILNKEYIDIKIINGKVLTEKVIALSKKMLNNLISLRQSDLN